MQFLLCAQAAIALLFSSLAVDALSLDSRAATCNGHAELCSRSYGNVSFVGAHDSYAVGVNNLATNQDYDMTQQLNDGVRLLQMQAHNDNGVIRLCHTDCFLYNGGTLEDYLKKVKTWMDANPNDVVTLLIVNIDNIGATLYDTVFKAVGLDTMSYAPPTAVVPASQWPTLNALIDSGKRLLTFLDNGANFATVPYLIDEFTNIWETPFNVVDPTFDCNVNRTKGDTGTQMYLINHFLNKLVLGNPAPDRDRANTTNAVSGVGSLGLQVEQCAAQHGKYPSFFLVDFYEFGGGSVFQVAATANGVTYTPSKAIATPISEATASGRPSTASSGSRSSAQIYTSFSVVAGILLGAWSVVS